MGSQRVRHNWATNTYTPNTHTHTHTEAWLEGTCHGWQKITPFTFLSYQNIKILTDSTLSYFPSWYFLVPDIAIFICLSPLECKFYKSRKEPKALSVLGRY